MAVLVQNGQNMDLVHFHSELFICDFMVDSTALFMSSNFINCWQNIIKGFLQPCNPNSARIVAFSGDHPSGGGNSRANRKESSKIALFHSGRVERDKHNLQLLDRGPFLCNFVRFVYLLFWPTGVSLDHWIGLHEAPARVSLNHCWQIVFVLPCVSFRPCYDSDKQMVE
ncbi:hypothetical protein AVEN_228027-1 [Araneus ventricosus]|uniref:Uncharacterized protein n=1 Tax=Araneus ventricosus TaxID=182803 RepID=A0A4Y2LSV4_ARAVE|nr:hypothetical protein AVEN_222391-1 [Araneus ventricosus]GBN69839.1 hypothetical protein AVEN_228027-1 [Araneus ventricosus]